MDRVDWEQEEAKKRRSPHHYLVRGRNYWLLIYWLYRAYELGYEDGERKEKYSLGEQLCT